MELWIVIINENNQVPYDGATCNYSNACQDKSCLFPLWLHFLPSRKKPIALSSLTKWNCICLMCILDVLISKLKGHITKLKCQNEIKSEIVDPKFMSDIKPRKWLLERNSTIQQHHKNSSHRQAIKTWECEKFNSDLTTNSWIIHTKNAKICIQNVCYYWPFSFVTFSTTRKNIEYSHKHGLFYDNLVFITYDVISWFLGNFPDTRLNTCLDLISLHKTY